MTQLPINVHVVPHCSVLICLTPCSQYLVTCEPRRTSDSCFSPRRLSLRCGRRLFRAKGEISRMREPGQKRRGNIFFPSRVILSRPVGYEPTSFSHDVMTATSVYHNNETVCHASVIFLITRWNVENNGFLASVPLLPPPRAWSRALIPFPFPFERLPRKLVKTLFCSNELYSCRPRE